MPLSPQEIVVGAIAYFDVAILHAEPAVIVTGDPVTRDVTGNQFVCYRVDGQSSYWSPLTATYKFRRTKIDQEWVINGYGPLAAGQVWLQDGKNTYRGPNAAFIAATAKSDQSMARGPCSLRKPSQLFMR